jgi:hypothetical protein
MTCRFPSEKLSSAPLEVFVTKVLMIPGWRTGLRPRDEIFRQIGAFKYAYSKLMQPFESPFQGCRDPNSALVL